MLKFIYLTLSAIICLNCFCESVSAQKKKIPKEPFQIIDASTGKPIPEVLIIPRYYSVRGVAQALFVNGKNGYRNYLDKPFIYRTGEPFILSSPKFNRVPLIQMSVGIGRDVDEVLVVAPKYRPSWMLDPWAASNNRKVQLTPISDDEWEQILQSNLKPLIKEKVLKNADSRFWGVSLYNADKGFWEITDGKKFTLYIYYNDKERELVRSFLWKDSANDK